jgi:hypothetical protein
LTEVFFKKGDNPEKKVVTGLSFIIVYKKNNKRMLPEKLNPQW